jgi:oxygen-independent coproporphyrinogen-3 oxidase
VTSHHLYVHVPFCRLVCPYCDFVTVGGRADVIPRYVDALLDELALRPAPGRLETVSFGGGTPSLLPAAAVERVLGAAVDRWRRSPGGVALEANPSSREVPDWSGLRSAGVTRISLGVQSLDDRDLAVLARGHTAAEARAAYAAARGAGFDDVSIDLIYAIPGQTLQRWQRVLRDAVALAPDHVSCYALQLVLAPDEWAAPPRPGALRWRQRLAGGQDDGLAAAQYRLAEEVLGQAGYGHYELSSWARPGHRSAHNVAYWTRRPYTGIGAGAHSFDGTVRAWNLRDLDRYLAAVRNGQVPVEGDETLDAAAAAFEGIALGLRQVEGLSRARYRTEHGADPLESHGEAVESSTRDGLLEVDGDRLRLSAAGRLLANEVLVRFAPGRPGAR